MKLKYRTIFISDTHLGSRPAQAQQLADFLKRVKCEKLYLVGDIVDIWRMKSKWYWPKEHNQVIRRLLKLNQKGTRVIFIPGNHDEDMRQFAGLAFGGIITRKTDVHETVDGKKLLIMHGDEFDLVIRHSKLISVLGSIAYEWLIVFNRFYNFLRRCLGYDYWSFSQFIKLKVKSACKFISRFEQTLMEHASKKGMDGVVCGHIHKAEIIRAGEGENNTDVDYFNCGDWVESCTALVEHYDGTIELLRNDDIKMLFDAEKENKKIAAQSKQSNNGRRVHILEPKLPTRKPVKA